MNNRTRIPDWLAIRVPLKSSVPIGWTVSRQRVKGKGRGEGEESPVGGVGKKGGRTSGEGTRNEAGWGVGEEGIGRDRDW